MPALFSDKPLKVTTPWLAVAVCEPPRVLPPGLVARAMLTLPEKLFAVFPKLSKAPTCKPNSWPSVRVPGGWLMIASCDAAAAATLKLLLVTEGGPVLLVAETE